VNSFKKFEDPNPVTCENLREFSRKKIRNGPKL